MQEANVSRGETCSPSSPGFGRSALKAAANDLFIYSREGLRVPGGWWALFVVPSTRVKTVVVVN